MRIVGRRQRLHPDREADGGNGRGGAELAQQPVIAAAGDQRLGAVALAMQLELEAGVVVEAASEGGGEAYLVGVDAMLGHEADARLELVDRSSDVETGISGEA